MSVSVGSKTRLLKGVNCLCFYLQPDEMLKMKGVRARGLKRA